MNIRYKKTLAATAGMSLVELMIASSLGTLVLGGAVTIFIYGLFSFAGLGNYAILTGQSRLSLDKMSREIREATGVVAYQSAGTSKWLTVTNGLKGTTVKYSWDAGTGILTCQTTGQPDRVCLSGCDQWDFNIFQRSPRTNWTFYTSSSVDTAKLINMSWKCSRTILGKKINTENVVTAQVVMRNS